MRWAMGAAPPRLFAPRASISSCSISDCRSATESRCCANLRGRGDSTPVIIVTARDDVRNRIEGLDAGADDYIIKPFDLDEVSARMRSVLRRAAGRGDPCIRHRGISSESRDACGRTGGRCRCVLSAHEFSVLEALLQRPGAVLSRAQLEDRLYGWSGQIESNAIEVYIHGLRRKLGSDAIRTLRGVGYFVPKE